MIYISIKESDLSLTTTPWSPLWSTSGRLSSSGRRRRREYTALSFATVSPTSYQWHMALSGRNMKKKKQQYKIESDTRKCTKLQKILFSQSPWSIIGSEHFCMINTFILLAMSTWNRKLSRHLRYLIQLIANSVFRILAHHIISQETLNTSEISYSIYLSQ